MDKDLFILLLKTSLTTRDWIVANSFRNAFRRHQSDLLNDVSIDVDLYKESVIFVERVSLLKLSGATMDIKLHIVWCFNFLYQVVSRKER